MIISCDMVSVSTNGTVATVTFKNGRIRIYNHHAEQFIRIL